MKKILILILFLFTVSSVEAVSLGLIGNTKRKNTISFTTPNNMTVGDADQTMTCSATSGDPCAYTSNTASYCTIFSGKLHAVAAGTCTVNADDTGNINFFAAPTVTSGNVTISAGASCTLQVDYSAGTTAYPAGDVDNRTYVGQRNWSDVSNHTICQVNFKLTKAAGDISTKTFYAKIWSVTGLDLNSILCTSAGVTGSNAWSSSDVAFTFSGCSYTGGTNVSITLDMGTFDGTNYANTYWGSASGSGNLSNWNSLKSNENDFSGDLVAVKIYW